MGAYYMDFENGSNANGGNGWDDACLTMANMNSDEHQLGIRFAKPTDRNTSVWTDETRQVTLKNNTGIHTQILKDR